ncbi:phenylalanine ammonia-lyase [Clohesyomyces aquaticus]|uniref:Phenylalanine ammonia-lyase n=1 Tax=Clohesyomyces aquaticus TaxID=1231657 RepID=A0A1Y1YGX3_9PLEO|nr:phenylalanine ammonia-lyase [Clohesyomyces aquaticus]
MAAKDAGTDSQKHFSLVVSELSKLSSLRDARNPLVIDGESLDMASVVAVAKHCVGAVLSGDILEKLGKSVRLLNERLRKGEIVYGINTGFGGSADTRCSPGEMHTLQRSLLQHLNCGVLPMPGGGSDTTSMSLKEEWVRAAILIRANSLARGHSAVRPKVIESLVTLLLYDVIPLVPLRGSISASGDLSPLSYIAGALEGNPDIPCWIGSQGSRALVSAPEALASIGLSPITFDPKEGLGLVNGTAVSCAVATLTLHSMHNLVLLSQLLTAMNVEAILGTSTSFAPFISAVRPHPGQSEVASIILSALSGSQLAEPLFEQHATSSHGLFQDRYSLRTAPQWLGPFIEDLLLAHRQLEVEMNSTTDNPLIDPSTGLIYHGGNFQAVSVTSAMEKSRLAAQAVGRMLFAQFTEMLNPATNRGLPPNLCADDPSTSFTMKGLDTAMASYISELSFLGNPVHNHVVSAEMGNQSVNSLALVSARYTDTAVEILTLMCATTLYAACQALDLRAMERKFAKELEDAFTNLILDQLDGGDLDDKTLASLSKTAISYILQEMPKTTTMDTKQRFGKILWGSLADLVQTVAEEELVVDLGTLVGFIDQAAEVTEALYDDVRQRYLFQDADVSDLLGRASRRLYRYVRHDLGVPMHRGVIDHPVSAPQLPLPGRNAAGNVIANGNLRHEEIIVNGQTHGSGETDGWRKRTIGHWVSVINGSIKSGKIMDVVVDILKEGSAA